MLFWIKFNFLFIFSLLITLNLFLKNLMSLILVSELIIVLLFFLFLFCGLIFNLNWLFGFSFLIVILGGLELALIFLFLSH